MQPNTSAAGQCSVYLDQNIIMGNHIWKENSFMILLNVHPNPDT